MADDELIRRATAELEQIGLVPAGAWRPGYVVRMPKAYPVYDAAYAGNVDVVQEWLGEHAANVWPVGSQRHAPLQQPGPLDVHGHARPSRTS